MPGPLAVLLLLLLALPAHAAPGDARHTFALGADIGAAGRWFDEVGARDVDAWALGVGARAELHALAHARAEVRWLEGRMFHRGEDRVFDLDVAARTPKVFVFALDLHRLYWRASTRPGDRVLAADAGLGVVGDLFGTLKGSLGYAHRRADGVDDLDPRQAHGAYLGVEYLLRLRFFEATVRGTAWLAFHEREAYAGLSADADLMVRIPVRAVYLGPRLDVSYRTPGLMRSSGDLFEQRQELTGIASFAFLWGTGTPPGARHER